MRALFLIPKENPPTLEGNFSKSYKEFVAACLMKDPEERQSISVLLKHKFVNHKKKTSFLVDLLDKYRKWKNENDDEEEEDDDEE